MKGATLLPNFIGEIYFSKMKTPIDGAAG